MFTQQSEAREESKMKGEESEGGGKSHQGPASKSKDFGLPKGVGGGWF